MRQLHGGFWWSWDGLWRGGAWFSAGAVGGTADQYHPHAIDPHQYLLNSPHEFCSSSYNIAPLTPRKSLVSEEKVAVAVPILIRVPTLTVREAMLAAEFTPSEANTKTMQRKVARSLPGKSKCGWKENIPLSTVNIATNVSEASPLTDQSASNNGNLMTLPPRKLKKQRLNSHQAQDKWEADLVKKARFSKAHMAATGPLNTFLSENTEHMFRRNFVFRRIIT